MSTTPDHMRGIALALPEAVEGAHMGRPDFRVRGKIFATLTPERGLAVVKLTGEQQEMVCAAEPAMFAPVPGGWGRRGWTRIRLGALDETTLASALMMAWRNVAPKRLVATLDGGDDRAWWADAAPRASVRTLCQQGESPCHVVVTPHEAEGNRVAARRGGKQLEAKG